MADVGFLNRSIDHIGGYRLIGSAAGLCRRFGQRLATVAKPRLHVNLILSSVELVFDSVRQDEKVGNEVHALLESVMLRRDIRWDTPLVEEAAGRSLLSSLRLLRVVESI